VEIRKYCPLYSVGDRLRIDGPRVVVGRGEPLCPYALSSLMPYVQRLESGVEPRELGLARPDDGEHAYIPCGEECRYYSEGGCVVFRCQANGAKLWKARARV
jgi:uncharacterized repeat protein (TIGR04076 family)